MSGSISLSDAPLGAAERVDVRRFCGYPAYGTGATGAQSWRFFQAYGMLEYRLTNFAAEELQVVRQYLASLYTLEAAIVTASGNLDTEKAAVWTRNQAEILDRTRLFDEWRRRLAIFIGIPLDPGIEASTRIVV